MTVPSSQVCGHCGREAPEYSCSRCRSTRFCGPDCFRKAWRWHKLTCQNVSISSVSPTVETGECPAAPSQKIGGSGGAGVVVVVPFREQLPLQHRGEQLARFLPHMQRFLCGLEVPARVLVVEQNQDGRKFNRGQLLNVGFTLAEQLLPLSAFIMHDVDLLPSDEMQKVYERPPPQGCAVHLASVWPKYSYANFIGGVLSFRPEEFKRINGYPNNYWGWGLEDDQLGLRMAHHGLRTLRLRVGSFEDLDPVNMKEVLECGRTQPDRLKKHLPWYNADMFKHSDLELDPDWSTNGLKNLRFKRLKETTDGILHHVVVELESN